MRIPLEDRHLYALLALLVLAVFYGIYFAKVLAQKHRGIQTRQIGRRKEKSIHTVEVLMCIATLGAPIARDRRKFCVIDVPRQYENLRLSQE